MDHRVRRTRGRTGWKEMQERNGALLIMSERELHRSEDKMVKEGHEKWAVKYFTATYW